MVFLSYLTQFCKIISLPSNKFPMESGYRFLLHPNNNVKLRKINPLVSSIKRIDKTGKLLNTSYLLGLSFKKCPGLIRCHGRSRPFYKKQFFCHLSWETDTSI